MPTGGSLHPLWHVTAAVLPAPPRQRRRLPSRAHAPTRLAGGGRDGWAGGRMLRWAVRLQPATSTRASKSPLGDPGRREGPGRQHAAFFGGEGTVTTGAALVAGLAGEGARLGARGGTRVRGFSRGARPDQGSHLAT
eukprot:scaffold668_cov385-Prasinococcus_capsulatus_cf.AAC.5